MKIRQIKKFLTNFFFDQFSYWQILFLTNLPSPFRLGSAASHPGLCCAQLWRLQQRAMDSRSRLHRHHRRLYHWETFVKCINMLNTSFLYVRTCLQLDAIFWCFRIFRSCEILLLQEPPHGATRSIRIRKCLGFSILRILLSHIFRILQELSDFFISGAPGERYKIHPDTYFVPIQTFQAEHTTDDERQCAFHCLVSYPQPLPLTSTLYPYPYTYRLPSSLYLYPYPYTYLLLGVGR